MLRAGEGILPSQTFLWISLSGITRIQEKVRECRMDSPARYKRALP